MPVEYNKMYSKYISLIEKEIAHFNVLIERFYKEGDKELVSEFKKYRQESESTIKIYRAQTALMNQGFWGFQYEVK